MPFALQGNGGGRGGIDSHFLRSHFDPSFVYNSRLHTNLYACPDWPPQPRKLHLIPGSCRSSLHSGCFFLTRAVFIHSLHQMFMKHLLGARHIYKGLSYPFAFGLPNESYYAPFAG